MKRGLTFVIAVTTLLAGCSKEAAYWAQEPEESGFGKMEISIIDATTRADERREEGKIYLDEMYSDWQDRNWSTELAVVLSNDEKTLLFDDEHPYTTYGSVVDFNRNNKVKATDKANDNPHYSVKVVSQKSNGSYEDVELYDYTNSAGTTVEWYKAIGRSDLVIKAPEGLRCPYFEGEATNISVKPSTVENPDPTTVPVTVKIANSAVYFKFSETFKKYFAEAKFTLASADGFKQEIGYTATKETGIETYYWINPRPFTLEGTVKRQSPGTGLEGETVKDITISTTTPEAGHCYTYTIDISTVGGNGGIDIKYNDKVVGTVEHKFEIE